MKRAILILAVLVLVLGGTSRAKAGVLTVYTSPAPFDASTSGLTDVNFNGIVGPTAFTNSVIPPGYTDAATGTNFTFPNAPGTDINVTGRNFYSPTDFPNDFLVAAANVPIGSSELITLPTSATAVGLMFSTFNQAALVFTLSNGDSYTDTTTPAFGNVAFLGFTDTAPFTTLTISNPTLDDVTLLLDVQYGTAVPEPSSLTLLGLGFLTVAGYGWRRRVATGKLANRS